MAADNRTTDPNGLCSSNLVTMAQRNLCTVFINTLIWDAVTLSFFFKSCNSLSTANPIFIFSAHKRIYLSYRSNFIIFFPVLFFSRIAGLTNNSSNLETKSFRSSYMKGVIGLSDWYFFKKGSTIWDTKLKSLSFAKVKGSLMASWTFL